MSQFHPVSPFHRLVRNLMVVGLVLVWLFWGLFVCLLCVVDSWPFIFDQVV